MNISRILIVSGLCAILLSTGCSGAPVTRSMAANDTASRTQVTRSFNANRSSNSSYRARNRFGSPVGRGYNVRAGVSESNLRVGDNLTPNYSRGSNLNTPRRSHTALTETRNQTESRETKKQAPGSTAKIRTNEATEKLHRSSTEARKNAEQQINRTRTSNEAKAKETKHTPQTENTNNTTIHRNTETSRAHGHSSNPVTHTSERTALNRSAPKHNHSNVERETVGTRNTANHTPHTPRTNSTTIHRSTETLRAPKHSSNPATHTNERTALNRVAPRHSYSNVERETIGTRNTANHTPHMTRTNNTTIHRNTETLRTPKHSSNPATHTSERTALNRVAPRHSYSNVERGIVRTRNTANEVLVDGHGLNNHVTSSPYHTRHTANRSFSRGHRYGNGYVRRNTSNATNARYASNGYVLNYNNGYDGIIRDYRFGDHSGYGQGYRHNYARNSYAHYPRHYGYSPTRAVSNAFTRSTNALRGGAYRSGLFRTNNLNGGYARNHYQSPMFGYGYNYDNNTVNHPYGANGAGHFNGTVVNVPYVPGVVAVG